MEAAHTPGVIDCVEKVVASLEVLDSAPTKLGDDGDAQRAKATALDTHAKELHALVDNMSKERVLILPADQLMECGIVLYNAARTTYKKYQSRPQERTSSDSNERRFLILFVRFLAARVMGLALTCSRGVEMDSTSSAGDQSVFVDDCLDVIRSYGRIGSLLIDTVSTASNKCYEYLVLAKEALGHANDIWGRLGLSFLTRFRSGVELDEILQDLWDFCVDRLRAGHLLQAYTSDDFAVSSFVETLHELQMLLPYMCGNSQRLLELVQRLIDDCNLRGRFEELVMLSEEALRLCDAVESQDIREGWSPATYRQSYLTALLCALEYLGDVEKAEACFALLGPNRPPSAFLTMIRLYLHQHMSVKATTAMNHLLQMNDVAASIAGARMFAEASAFSAESINIYRQLERHYGDHTLEIGLDLACALATSDMPQHRAQSMSEVARLCETVKTMSSDTSVTMNGKAKRTLLIVHDAVKNTLNEGTVEECLGWTELALELASTPVELASLKRVMAAAFLKASSYRESWNWAKSAMDLDSSKASLLSMFEALLGLNDDHNVALDLCRQLKTREDFKPQDLVTYAYCAHNRGLEDICLAIMDDLCCILRNGKEMIEELPIGILLQNTAQLTLRAFSTTSNDAEKSSTTSYATKFMNYVDMFLFQAEKQDSTSIDRFAPPAVFVWFYTMSFNVARSCNNGQLFVRAADCAQQAFRLFGVECQIAQREAECLLAALGTVMVEFDKLDRDSLASVLELVARIKRSASREHEDFVVKSELASRLRLYDPDVASLRKLCQEEMLRSVSNYIEVGELILQAASIDEAKEVRSAYRGLARDMFKLGLQLILQSDHLESTQMVYLFRRLVTLAEAREEVLDWFGQLVQLHESVNFEISEMEAEWFVIRAWNLGVQCHRRQLIDEAQKFLKMALSLLASIGPALKQLTSDLHDQYQEFASLSRDSVLAVD